MTSAGILQSHGTNHIANCLLGLNSARDTYYANGRTPEADSLWLQHIKSEIGQLGLDAPDDEMTDAYKAKIFAVLQEIDDRNTACSQESEKKRPDADVLRAIAWNKGARGNPDFRHRFASYDCVRVPLTRTGSFRVFTNEGASSWKDRFNFNSLPGTASSRLKGVNVLQILRARKNNPDGFGWLGGLSDFREPYQMLKDRVLEKLQQLVSTIAFDGELTFEGDMEGKTAQDIARTIQTRAGEELFATIGNPIQMAIKIIEAAKNGDDRIYTDIMGRLRMASLGTEKDRVRTAENTSRREAIEELTNVLEYLKIAISEPALDRNANETAIRKALHDQLDAFIGKLKDVDNKQNLDAARAGQSWNVINYLFGGRKNGDPLGQNLKQIPLRHVRDDAYFYVHWKPNTIDEALRPPPGVPKVGLIEPIGFRNRLPNAVFKMFAEAGEVSRAIAEEVKAGSDPALAGVRRTLENNELRGLQSIDLLSALKQYGRKGGEFKQAMTGNDLAYSYCYAHEYFGLIDEAREQFEKKPVAGKSASDMLVGLIGELQQDIIDHTVYPDEATEGQSLKKNEGVYTIDIMTMVRMMNGGRLDSEQDIRKHALAAGLEANVFQRMHKKAEDVMAANGYETTATPLKQTLEGARPFEPGVVKPAGPG
jgi:hypothetical protein